MTLKELQNWIREEACWSGGGCVLGWFKNSVSSQTEKLMGGTKFSDYLGLNHYKKAKKLKKFIHFHFTYRPQSFGSKP